MDDIKCIKCENEMIRYEYFIKLENGENICESCFFDIAIEKLNAKEMQLGLDEVIDVKKDRKDNYNSFIEEWE